MKPVIWYELQPDDEILARLQPVADVVVGGDVKQLANVAAVVISSLVDANGDFMDAVGPSLQVIARPGIGIDNVDVPAATARGILVIHTPDAPSESTAEHAVALLMAVAKRVVTGARQLQGQPLPRSALLGSELRDRTVGVVGFGRIGRRVAEMCGLGIRMRVLVYDPFVTHLDQPGAELVADLNELLERSDFVTLHTPLTPQTRHLIGAAALRRMKKGAYLINASRGPVVDEAALIQALQEGHLAGAALDVFDPEPPKPDNPLLQMPNVVCTPHTASFTDRGVRAMRHGIVDQLLQILRGERPPFLANPAAWPGRTAR